MEIWNSDIGYQLPINHLKMLSYSDLRSWIRRHLHTLEVLTSNRYFCAYNNQSIEAYFSGNPKSVIKITKETSTFKIRLGMAVFDDTNVLSALQEETITIKNIQFEKVIEHLNKYFKSLDYTFNNEQITIFELAMLKRTIDGKTYYSVRTRHNEHTGSNQFYPTNNQELNILSNLFKDSVTLKLDEPSSVQFSFIWKSS